MSRITHTRKKHKNQIKDKPIQKQKEIVCLECGLQCEDMQQLKNHQNDPESHTWCHICRVEASNSHFLSKAHLAQITKTQDQVTNNQEQSKEMEIEENIVVQEGISTIPEHENAEAQFELLEERYGNHSTFEIIPCASICRPIGLKSLNN